MTCQSTEEIQPSRARPESAAKSRPGYRSPFQDWHVQACVRAKPSRSFDTCSNLGAGVLCFSPELVAAAEHPLVKSQGEKTVQHILAYHLFAYLNFTDALENEVVAPVAYMIGKRQLGFSFADVMIADARKIAVDEMHHALLVTDLAERIARFMQLDPIVAYRPRFLFELDRVKAQNGSDLTALIMLFFAIVSETLITATLTRVPHDERVTPTVRQILRDHAEDEARHHAYFSEALAICWPQLTPSQRTVIGPLLPRFMMMFLWPNLEEIRQWLRQAGLSGRDAEGVIAEAYAPPLLIARAKKNAEASIRQMRRAGVLDDRRAADAFAEAGLFNDESVAID